MQNNQQEQEKMGVRIIITSPEQKALEEYVHRQEQRRTLPVINGRILKKPDPRR